MSNPYGQPDSSPQPYGQQPYGQQPYGQAYGQSPDGPVKRPGTVLAASIIAIVMSGLVAVLGVIGVIGLLVARDDVVDALDDEISGQAGFEDFSAGDLANVITVMLIVLVIWAVIGLVLGILTLRGQNWARITLVVSAAVTALLSLLGITAGVTLLTLGTAIATIVLLFTGGANQWFSASKDRRA